MASVLDTSVQDIWMDIPSNILHIAEESALHSYKTTVEPL